MQQASDPTANIADTPHEIEKSRRCRYCGSTVLSNAVKCPECKSIQIVNTRALTDSQLLLTIGTPISAIVAALTYLISVATPNSSNVSFDPAGRNAGLRYYVITNRGNSNAHLVRATTRIYFSPPLRKAAGLPNQASDDDFITAAPLSVSLDNGVIPPGGRPMRVQMQDYQPTKDGVNTTNYHFDVMIDLVERKLKRYASENNKVAAEALVELLTYLVGIDDSTTTPEADNRLGGNFIFRIDFYYMNYNDSQTMYSHPITPRSYTHWIGNYSDVRNKESFLCQRIRTTIDEVRSMPLKLDENRLHRGLCF